MNDSQITAKHIPVNMLNMQLFLFFLVVKFRHWACADLEGGSGGPNPPWNLQSLISPILLEMKKVVIFHICALPQLYDKVGPPLEKFSGSAPVGLINTCISDSFSHVAYSEESTIYSILHLYTHFKWQYCT